MDTDFSTTQERYLRFLTDTPELIRSSLEQIDKNERNNFAEQLHKAKRIFFTAAGSSIPAALYGTYELQQRGFAASFLPTGSVLGLKSLGRAIWLFYAVRA